MHVSFKYWWKCITVELGTSQCNVPRWGGWDTLGFCNKRVHRPWGMQIMLTSNHDPWWGFWHNFWGVRIPMACPSSLPWGIILTAALLLTIKARISILTFILPFLYRYRYEDPNYEMKLNKVYLFWICPDTNAFEWFTDLLKQLEHQMAEAGRADFVEYNIYLTRGWDSNIVSTTELGFIHM